MKDISYSFFVLVYLFPMHKNDELYDQIINMLT